MTLFIIELFSRKLESLNLPEDAMLTPIPLDESVSSLSAILLDDAYYEFLQNGVRTISNVSVLDTGYLIPFKAKAWLDLTLRKQRGELIDSKTIRKHKNNVFRISVLLRPDIRILLNPTVYTDMMKFIQEMESESVDVRIGYLNLYAKGGSSSEFISHLPKRCQDSSYMLSRLSEYLSFERTSKHLFGCNQYNILTIFRFCYDCICKSAF